ncbi:MAG: LCP family protein [Lachnospiraceae bacterium]|nr:LCP family protein [Lachnospiraceae bacterium]
MSGGTSDDREYGEIQAGEKQHEQSQTHSHEHYQGYSHEHHHTHHHRHHHHHLNHHRRLRRRRLLLSSAAVVAVVFCIAGGLIRQAWVRQQSLLVTAENTYDAGSEGYREVTYDGETWSYNNRVTTILLARVDSSGKMEESKDYGTAANADSIELIVMDEYNNRLTVVAVNRDTMTQNRRYSSTGDDEGLSISRLGNAYTWGNGGTVSCESLTEAVSLLFGGIPVLDYIVLNQDSMVYVNDMVGGVTVTVPNSELSGEYPELTEGAVVTLDETNVLAFLQYRNTSEGFSNEGQMERQQAYTTAYIEAVRQMSISDYETAWENLTEMGDYLQTSITRRQFLKLANLVLSLDFSETNYIQLSVGDEAGEQNDELYVDEEVLQQTILDLFYIKE